ncbi:MAG: signal peptide peptidase SppA [Bacteroidales bacterium]|nr:signal peptide peptidase SppA [Bacteroidales bacterium]
MKDFVKMVLAVICGLFIMGIICFILTFGMIGSLAAAGSSKPVLPKSGVLKIDLSKVVLGEQTQESNPLSDLDPTSLLMGGGMDSSDILGIWDAVQAINAAAEDPAVKYIYLCTDGNGSDVTALSELRVALEHYRATSGNPVVAYMENPGAATYYLASVSDKIYMAPYLGLTPQFTGIGTQMFFLGDLLKRVGVNVQLIRHGKYKSAGEMYTRNSASPENREQYQRMIDSIWETLGATIAEARGISVEQLDETISGLKLRLPQDFVDYGLADELLDRDALEDKLASLAVEEKYKDIKWISLADYAEAKLVPSKARQKIAVIYADGEIIDGNGKSEIAGDRFATVINKVRADSTVKAVVLRVNSPGGSVTASEKIKDALDKLKAEKPVVASYGGYAASGGYWISNNCEKIFTDAATLTGSIGVFGLIPDFSKTASDIAHVGVESVTSHKHGDMMGLMRPLDKDEYDFMFTGIEAVYDRFTTIVSEGRGIPKEFVDAVGQGRVWTGADALKINLVDEIGTLEDAINYAAVAAGDGDLAQWNIKGYPAPPSMMEQMMDMLGGNKNDDNALLKAARKITTPQILARMDNEIVIR